MIVALYQAANRRAESVCKAMMSGIAQSGQCNVLYLFQDDYEEPIPTADVVVTYGLGGNGMKLLKEYRKAGKGTVFVDLPYWGRKGEQPDGTYHRFSVNGYQPTHYFRKTSRAPDRFEKFGRHVLAWGAWHQNVYGEILVAGMSEKASQVWGLGSATEHARSLVKLAQRYSTRPIAYRPKPSWADAEPIPGTRYATGDLKQNLMRTSCVLTYRSNVAVDALLAGVPVCVVGDHPASVMGRTDARDLERPIYPDDRLSFFSDLAYCQYSIGEMRDGTAWNYLLSLGLF